MSERVEWVAANPLDRRTFQSEALARREIERMTKRDTPAYWWRIIKREIKETDVTDAGGRDGE